MAIILMYFPFSTSVALLINPEKALRVHLTTLEERQKSSKNNQAGKLFKFFALPRFGFYDSIVSRKIFIIFWMSRNYVTTTNEEKNKTFMNAEKKEGKNLKLTMIQIF